MVRFASRTKVHGDSLNCRSGWAVVPEGKTSFKTSRGRVALDGGSPPNQNHLRERRSKWH